MNSLFFFFRKYRLEEVFTPSTIATLTYIRRSMLENDLDKFLRMPGMQLVLYGHSGCGKSTLIYNKLALHKTNYITTSCSSNTTFNGLMSQAFDKLNVFYLSEKTHSKKSSCISNLKAEYAKLSSSISHMKSEENTAKSIRILPIQLSPDRLAEFLGGANCVWVIEDFHKVVDTEKKKIADVMKIFMDAAKMNPQVKIICIGAVGTARELIELDTNLNTRVAEIYVPLLNNVELNQILLAGFRLLNIKCTPEFREKVVYYSNNLASVCHQICYDISYNRRVHRSQVFPITLIEDDFKMAVISYVRKNSDTLAKHLDKIATDSYRKLILLSLVNSELESATLSELLYELRKNGKIEENVVIPLLEELISPDYNEVLRYDRNSEKYSFSSPFFQAFLKMKIALEKAEKVERQLKKENKQHYVIRSRSDNRIAFHFDDKIIEEVMKEWIIQYQKILISQKTFIK